MRMPHYWMVGPGALGRLLAIRLAGEARVTLVGRRLPACHQTLITPEGERLSRRLGIATIDALPGETPDLVHLTTKATSARDAFAAMARHLAPDTPLILWQNGYGVQEEITTLWSGPVLCATTTEGAHVQNNRQVTHAGHGHTFVGTLDGRHGELATVLAATLDAAGLPAEAVDDIRTRLWHKLAINAVINPLVARFRIRNGQLRDAAYRGRVETLIGEVAAIMTAEGIRPPRGDGSDGWRLLVWRVIDDTAANRASMLQDVLAGRPTEHEAILGPLLAAARHHGLDVDYIQMHYRYLQDHQSP